MLRGRLTIVFTPTGGRAKRYDRTGSVVLLCDGALSFLLKILKRKR